MAILQMISIIVIRFGNFRSILFFPFSLIKVIKDTVIFANIFEFNRRMCIQ